MTIEEHQKQGFLLRIFLQFPLVKVAAACIIAALYFFGLTIPLVGPDEPRYAQVAREMYLRGDWITPTLGGFHWFEKPALLYWLQIVSYHLFGINEFAARFGPALFGLGTIAAIYVICRESENASSSSEKISFAELAALMAATSLGIIVFSRGASFDIILTFPLTASLACFYRYYRNNSAAWLTGFYIFAGVSTLAKGLVGVVFPFAIVFAFYAILRRRPVRFEIFSLFWGTAIVFLVAAIWYLPMYQRHGWEFIDEFFIQHHFRRYTTNQYFHPQPFYFFFWVLPLMTLPWLPFFFAEFYGLTRIFLKRVKSSAFNDLEVFAVVWTAVPLLFFSFSGSKLPGYILPSLPPALILSAFAAKRFITNSRNGLKIILSIASATIIFSITLLLTVVPKFADDDSLKRLISEADAAGYVNLNIVGLHGVFHNAEFYAAGRLVRTSDGKQKKLYGVGELQTETDAAGGRILVLVPNEYAGQIADSRVLNAKLIARNSETALFVVSRP